jgi:hypothetical protein
VGGFESIDAFISSLTVDPGLMAAGHFPALNTTVDQLASVLKPLYLSLQQGLPAQGGAAQTISRTDRYAWRKLVATLGAVEKNAKS